MVMTWEGLNPPYSTIVADPPWHYDSGRVAQWNDSTLPTSFAMPYSTMTTEEIAALPVAALSTPGAHLYLWTTNHHLRSAFDVVSAWGFEFSQLVVWCKTPQGINTRGRFCITTEFILSCRDRRRAGALVRSAREAAGLGRADVHRLVRGGKPTGIVHRWEDDDCLPTVDDWTSLQSLLPELSGVPYPVVVDSERAQGPSTWFNWPRGRHSQKPPAFLDVVESVSPGPYVELFARAPRLGWDAWGKGYESSVA